MTLWPRDLADEIAQLQDELEWKESTGEGNTEGAETIRRRIRGLELELARIKQESK